MTHTKIGVIKNQCVRNPSDHKYRSKLRKRKLQNRGKQKTQETATVTLRPLALNIILFPPSLIAGGPETYGVCFTRATILSDLF